MNALNFANYIIWYVNQKFPNTSFTHVKLQKILYYVYCDFLKKGIPLFEDKIEKWQYGPVVPNVYNNFRSYGFNRISTPETSVRLINDENGFRFERDDFNPNILNLSTEQRDRLDFIIQNLVEKEAFELVNFTHKEKSWIRAEPNIKKGEKNIVYLEEELRLESTDIEELIG
ncbi:Panacea domain-containing protein [Acinetobacter sp. YH01021]|uniref:Panacea domain-containing protein n=1 Tax=Acinetobacter sp. YH01021 TaxID=2601035 RepID=UPI0015D1171E|nr:type II toxin-antitoxin system antitoxin SocA domain-containing protein [Acinetobacter sp. YH01021]